MEAPVRALFDTSVVVASLLTAHPEHGRSYRSLLEAKTGAVQGAISAHGLVECFSTLTRLPPGMRLAPELVLAALRGLSLDSVPLSLADYWEVLERSSQLGLAGGIVYDLLHLKAAELRAADRIVTLNARHFRRLAEGSAVDIVEP